MAGPQPAASPPVGDVGALLKKHADLALAAIVVVIVGMMIIPLPTFILDVFICANMASAVTMLLVAIYIPTALKIATFPTLLLITTLFRLALEVSATRLILLKANAGDVIHAFGNFVVAGNLVVGGVIFFILTMIQFIVIAKGSERVSEVGARFTLDAMPGKQMSIDAELRAGHIDHTEARRRRANLGRESQFFGSMDGAMKFVKGDAIAGIVVLITNIVGGLIIGIVQKGMDASMAAKTYTVLTIGEGLVSQIPALVISTAAGIIVTRVASEEEGSNLGKEIFGQLTGQPKALMIAAVLLVLLAIVPGFPAIPFLILSVSLGLFSFRLMKDEKAAREATPAADPKAASGGKPAASPADAGKASVTPERPIPARVPLFLEISVDLTEAFFPGGNTGDFFEKQVPGLRGDIFRDTGIMLPGFRIRPTYDLSGMQYQILIHEASADRGAIGPGGNLAIASAERLAEVGIKGETTNIPGIGASIWVSRADADRASEKGIPTLTGLEVVLRHAGATIRRFAAEFVGIEEAKQLVEAGVQQTHPSLVKEVIPRLVSYVQLADILRRLAEEGVSLRAMVDILGVLGEWAPLERDPVALTEHVRVALRRQILSKYIESGDSLHALVLDPAIEEAIRESIQRTPTGTYLALDPTTSRGISKAIGAAVTGEATRAVLLTSAEIRRFVRKLIETDQPQLAVLSFQELTPETKVRQLGRIKLG